MKKLSLWLVFTMLLTMVAPCIAMADSDTFKVAASGTTQIEFENCSEGFKADGVTAPGLVNAKEGSGKLAVFDKGGYASFDLDVEEAGAYKLGVAVAYNKAVTETVNGLEVYRNEELMFTNSFKCTIINHYM